MLLKIRYTLCFTLGLVACQKPPVPQEEIRPVRTQTIGFSAGSTTFTYAGDVQPRYQSMLSFRVGGKILSRKVDVGSAVTAGQTLFTLDASDLQLQKNVVNGQISASQAQLKMAELELNRYRDLFAKGFISQNDLDRQETQAKSLRAQVQSANAQGQQVANQSRYATLTADATGVVTAVLAEAGQVVAPGTPVVQVARTNEVEIATAIPEGQIAKIKVGMPVQIALWTDENEQTYSGQIRELASAADPATRTYKAKISVRNPPSNMHLGMTASVKIIQNSMAAIHIPLAALVTQNQQAGVWVVFNEKVRFTPIQYSGVDGDKIIVGKGLAANDVIVTAGAPFLTEGQKVKLLVPVAVSAPAVKQE